MTVTAVESRSATHYSLESFCEKRSTEWRTEAFIGQVIDGPMNGRAPSPWEVFVQPPAPFVESKLDMEVPHTASVKVRSFLSHIPFLESNIHLLLLLCSVATIVMVTASGIATSVTTANVSVSAATLRPDRNATSATVTDTNGAPCATDTATINVCPVEAPARLSATS